MAPTKHSSLAALASLTLLLFSPVSASEVPSLECLRTRSYELAAHSACGDEGALKHYFSTFPTDLSTGDEKFLKTLTKCYIDSGCNKEETPGQIVEAAKRCAAPAVHEHHHLGLRSLNEKGIYNHPGRLRIPVPAQPVVEARAAVTAAPVEPDVALMMSKVTAPAVLRRTDEAAETRPVAEGSPVLPHPIHGHRLGQETPLLRDQRSRGRVRRGLDLPQRERPGHQLHVQAVRARHCGNRHGHLLRRHHRPVHLWPVLLLLPRAPHHEEARERGRGGQDREGGQDQRHGR
ncbi:hypothetical protein SMACR_03765 [Sordaria macrospora]|uniref:Uncharacterized protein n=1 Tax=Sordaria macrospora TaxID=5147 RepID=A0A8S8ZII6_SORMA|nr:hypothetical protein SMACR_03765 [Sordaria macrospora]